MDDYKRNCNFQFGTSNPERMDKPFWKYMVCSGSSASGIRRNVPKDDFSENPVWCFERAGSTQTYLPDGRLICIGGEHEDYYDYDFQIYNDVVVIQNPHLKDCVSAYDVNVPVPSNFPQQKEADKNGKQKMLGTSNVNDVTIYGYPENVFPPTDFHTATYVKNTNNEFIYIIGGLGYMDSSHRKETHVYRLNLADFSIHEILTSGQKPLGSTERHTAKLKRANGRLVIEIDSAKCQKDRADGRSLESQIYRFDIETAVWNNQSIVKA